MQQREWLNVDEWKLNADDLVEGDEVAFTSEKAGHLGAEPKRMLLC